MFKTVLLLSALAAAVCLAAPQQDRQFELEVRGQDQQIPPTTDDSPPPSDSGSRMHKILSAGLIPFQRASTGALDMICTAIPPATSVSNFVQTYVLGILIWILGWASTVTIFLPVMSMPLSGVQVGLNVGRSVLSTVTFLASNYGCTVTDGLSGAINFAVNTLTRII